MEKAGNKNVKIEFFRFSETEKRNAYVCDYIERKGKMGERIIQKSP